MPKGLKGQNRPAVTLSADGPITRSPMMTRAQKIQRTQWTAQFLAASELVRNGYVVAFTMGNRTPVADLTVARPDATSLFWIDVKGLSSNNAWLIRRRGNIDNLFYILVRVGDSRDDDIFFILSHRQINELIDESHRLHPKDPTEGFGWRYPFPYRDNWSILPGWPRGPLHSN
jgi:hypothetical protein